MRKTNNSLKILGQLKRKINVNRYLLDDFYLACPYSIEELKSKKRNRELTSWRQIGITWSYLSGNTLAFSGEIFNRDHATVIHSVAVVLDSLNGYAKSEIINYIERIEIIEKNPIIVLIPYDKYLNFLKSNFMDHDSCEILAKSTYDFLPFLKLE